jgi:hypothetical protein
MSSLRTRAAQADVRGFPFIDPNIDCITETAAGFAAEGYFQVRSVSC